MRLLFHLCGNRGKASSRVRGYWIAEELEALGHETTLRVTSGKAGYLAFARAIPAHDAVIFQKTYSRYDLWLAALARRLGKRVLFDIDDAPSRSLSGPTMARAARMMRSADAVMAGSGALAELAREAGARAVHLVPSGVRLANYRRIAPRTAPDRVCLGWLGNGAHYADDLIGVLREPLAALAQRRPLRLRLVGACGEDRLHDAFGGIPGLTAELIDQVDWARPAAVAEAIAPFDIGLYPLKPGPFNDFKCGFKALEYMASGLPVVASRVAVNAEIVETGETGLLADGPDEWEAALETLCRDDALRARMGAAGYDRVVARFSTERIARQVAQIVEAAKERPTMHRPDENELTRLLICVECGAPLGTGQDGLSCAACGARFGWLRGRPVTMRADNALFPASAYTSAAGGRPPAARRGAKARLKALVPGRSVNLAREGVLARLAAEHDRDGVTILVVGCGNQTGQIARHFPGRARFVFTDIDKGADADVFCDAHDLPFANGAFDGVISTAVLEHVTRPGRVIEEVHRVLKPGAFLYSEIPFLQAVHEGAYDFTRFTLSGHRKLCERFAEEESGMVAGPGTALVWAIVEFARALPRSDRLAALFGMAAQTAFFWLKYTDRWIAPTTRATGAASCTYFLGTRRDAACSESDIIARYGDSSFSHT